MTSSYRGNIQIHCNCKAEHPFCLTGHILRLVKRNNNNTTTTNNNNNNNNTEEQEETKPERGEGEEG